MITLYIKLKIEQQCHFITVLLYDSNKMQLASIHNDKWNDSDMKHFNQLNNKKLTVFYLLEKAPFLFIILNQTTVNSSSLSLFPILHLL